MKHLFKLSGSLLLDQLVGCIAGWMMIPCVYALFKNSKKGFIIAFAFCLIFYLYTCYNSSFKSGFHDSHRSIKDLSYRGYLYKGALSGFMAAIPLMILYLVYLIWGLKKLRFYYMLLNTYWTWPMLNLFPNHFRIDMGLTFLPMILVPWLGYIAGYKNFLFTDYFVKIYNKFFKNPNV